MITVKGKRYRTIANMIRDRARINRVANRKRLKEKRYD